MPSFARERLLPPPEASMEEVDAAEMFVWWQEAGSSSGYIVKRSEEGSFEDWDPAGEVAEQVQVAVGEGWIVSALGSILEIRGKQGVREDEVVIKSLVSLFGLTEDTRKLLVRLPEVVRTGQIAAIFGVSERAVTNWARKGRLEATRTEGGHRRYNSKSLIKALLDSVGEKKS